MGALVQLTIALAIATVDALDAGARAFTRTLNDGRPR